jgi:hypothetical protein
MRRTLGPRMAVDVDVKDLPGSQKKLTIKVSGGGFYQGAGRLPKLLTSLYHIQHITLTYPFFGTQYSLYDRPDTAGVPVPPPRRLAPAISRFHPVLGLRTILQLLARRAAKSIAFSVPDRHVLWSRAEDDLLVQAVVKYSTSDVLGRDWIQVESDLPGRLPQQCKERCRLADTVAQLIFVFLRVNAQMPRLSQPHRQYGSHSETDLSLCI